MRPLDPRGVALLAASALGLLAFACSSQDPGAVLGGNGPQANPPAEAGPPSPPAPPPPPPPPPTQDSGGFPPETSDAGKPPSDSGAVVDDAAASDGAGGASDGGLAVVTFTLLNTAITNVVQGAPVPGYDPLVDGTTFSLATVGTQLSIRANTDPSPTGSVSFQLDGTQHTESALPYTLCGDNGAGTITNCNIAAGAHTLTATPYTAAALAGTAGAPLTINFTVTP